MRLCLEDTIKVQRILKYQDKLNFSTLVQNKNINLNIIKYLRANGFEDMLNGSVLSYSPYVTLQFIKEHSFLDWDWRILSYRASLSHSAISINDVLTNKHLPWQVYYLSMSTKLTIGDLIMNPNVDWNWRSLSATIEFKDIMKYRGFPWDYPAMSANPKLDIIYVLENTHIEWFYHQIYYYNEAVELILDNVDVWINFVNEAQFWNTISMNKNVTFEILNKYLEYISKWDWKFLSQVMNINDIKVNSELPWDIRSISWNPSLTLQYVLSQENADWFWEAVSHNAKFDMMDIEISQVPWVWEYLSLNTSFLDISDYELDNTSKKLIAVHRIKRRFREAICNPLYSLCRKRLLCEISNLISNY